MSTASEILPEEAVSLAKRIATLSGESEAQAVVVSLRERLERLEQRKRARDLLKVLRDEWRSRPKVDADFGEHSLYDENGLPL